jgi:pyridinium-3,5-biscarboxylic acid mononucleotide sulfurtransferase
MSRNPSMELAQKHELLKQTLKNLGSVLVAYSGGTDSAFLAYTAHQILGENMLAVIADSPSLPRAELAAALAFTAQHSIPTHILHTAELENPDYQRNDARRCFHCKDELFTQMETARKTRGFSHLAYGMNLDDGAPSVAAFRPGQQAATLHNAAAPLVTAQLTKPEIRQLAREAGLSLADKPASACLSSRIEYGRPVTRENLSQVEQAEEALHALGFPQVRVRHHSNLARIEIARTDLPRAFSLNTLDAITAALKPLGFLYITLDTQGYRTGSMNDVLPVSAISTASK